MLHDGGIGNSGIPSRRSSRSGSRVMSLNHTDGSPRIERMTPPSMIADFEADRAWSRAAQRAASAGDNH